MDYLGSDLSSTSLCPTCSSDFSFFEKECCIRSCVHFVDKLYVPQPDCECSFDSTHSHNGFSRQNACPHVRSTASLPELLDFAFDEQGRFVKSRVGIPVRSVFGPFVAHTHLPNSSSSELSSVSRSAEFSEESHNWMKFVREATNRTDGNLVAFQYEDNVYFAVIKEILVGEELRLYSPARNSGSPEPETVENIALAEIMSQDQPESSSAEMFRSFLIVSSDALSVDMAEEKETAEPNAVLSQKRKVRGKYKKKSADDLKEEPKPKRAKRADPDLSCPCCEVRFGEKDTKNYAEHLRTHRVAGKYPCRFCGQLFVSVRKHQKHVHASKKLFCTVCQYSTNSKVTLKRHMALHTGGDLKCSHCDEVFSMERDRKLHIGRYHEKTLPLPKRIFDTKYESSFFKCRDCKQSFSTRHRLILHLEYLHPETGFHTIPELNLPYKRACIYRCQICKKSSWLESTVRDHVEKMHGSQLGDDAELIGNEIKKETASAYICGICEAPFNGGKCFAVHVKCQHPEYEHSTIFRRTPNAAEFRRTPTKLISNET